MSEKEIDVPRRHYAEISKLDDERGRLLDSHSIEEARERDEEKSEREGREKEMSSEDPIFHVAASSRSPRGALAAPGRAPAPPAA